MRFPGPGGAASARRVLLTAAVAAAAVAVPAAAIARPAGPQPVVSGRQAGAAAAPCLSSSTLTWLGLGNGRGTLTGMFYPVEISNTSTRACTLTGFPAVWAVSGAGIQVGLPATTAGSGHQVVLGPGRTAHATLDITPGRDVAGCKLRPGSYLQVRLPGQAATTTIPGLRLTACANASVLRTGPVQAGTGVPGRVGPLGSARAS